MQVFQFDQNIVRGAKSRDRINLTDRIGIARLVKCGSSQELGCIITVFRKPVQSWRESRTDNQRCIGGRISKNNPDFLELLKNQTILLDWNYLPIVAEGQNSLTNFLTLAMNGR